MRRLCCEWRCPEEAVNGSRCERHRRQLEAKDRVRRGTAAQRGYDSRWRAYREWFIRQVNCECGRNHAFCEGVCRTKGLAVRAFAVDHIIPHRGNQDLFWNHGNHQSLCEREHNAKARSERLTGEA